MTTAVATLTPEGTKLRDFLLTHLNAHTLPSYTMVGNHMGWTRDDDRLGQTLLEVLQYELETSGLPLTAIVVSPGTGAPHIAFYHYLKGLVPAYKKVPNYLILMDCYKKLGYPTTI